MIASQDDCIAIKSGRDAEGRQVGIPTESVRITNCIFKSGFGVAIGSEMAVGVRNVLVQDCIFDDVYSVGSIKAPRGRGGVIENITYEDISYINTNTKLGDCKWFRGAIYMDQYYGHDLFDPQEKHEVDEGTSKIRNIKFKNIVLDTHAGNAIYIVGLPESPMEHVVLENIKAMGKHGMIVSNVQSLELSNVIVNCYEE